MSYARVDLRCLQWRVCRPLTKSSVKSTLLSKMGEQLGYFGDCIPSIPRLV